MIPIFMRLKFISGKTGKGFGLWIPLILVWPPLFVFFALLLPFLLLAEIILRSTNHPIPVLGMAWFPFTLLGKLHGTEIHVAGNHEKTTDSIDISII